MITVTVPESIDNSTSLQKLIDLTGNTPSKFEFSPYHEIEINSLLRVYNFTEWDGGRCQFSLMENAPLKPFDKAIPLIAPKYPTSAEGLILHDFKFDGRRDYQAKVPGWNGHSGSETTKQWGQGYHNLIMLGAINNVKYSNALNCEFYNLDCKNSLGDYIRLEGSSNIKIHDIKAKRGGHDAICAAATKNVEIWNLDIDTDVNAGVRFRSVDGGKIHDCNIRGTNTNTGPLIQVQNSAANWRCTNIDVYNNKLSDSLGPAMWIVATTGQNDILVRHNLFVNCGLEPASVKTDDVGGICIDGFNSRIENNTFDKCHGFGIVFSGWQTTSKLSGLKSEIRRNIITNTSKSYFIGTGSGSGIANLTENRNTIECSDNCLFGNVRDTYSVTNENGIYEDPCFADDYHLKDSSPCLKWGCYPRDPIPTKLLIRCMDNQTDQITKMITQPYKIYRNE